MKTSKAKKNKKEMLAIWDMHNIFKSLWKSSEKEIKRLNEELRKEKERNFVLNNDVEKLSYYNKNLIIEVTALNKDNRELRTNIESLSNNFNKN
jgi:septal ring factor EnvC (AmiA/AmiB activator)